MLASLVSYYQLLLHCMAIKQAIRTVMATQTCIIELDSGQEVPEKRWAGKSTAEALLTRTTRTAKQASQPLEMASSMYPAPRMT